MTESLEHKLRAAEKVVEAAKKRCRYMQAAPEKSGNLDWERGIATAATIILKILEGTPPLPPPPDAVNDKA